MDYSKNTKRLAHRLERETGKAIADYNMIEHGDTVLVCVSGGKDSLALLSILMTLQRRAPVDFRLIAMNLDQKLPGFPADLLPAHFERLGVEYRIVEQDTRAIVLEKKYGDRKGERLRAMINAVVHREAESAVEYLETMADLEGGCSSRSTPS